MEFLYSEVRQVCETFRKEIMNKGLEVDLTMASDPPIMNVKFRELYSRFNNLSTACLRKMNADPKNANAYFEESKQSVFKDNEIKRLIEDLSGTVNKWLERNP